MFCIFYKKLCKLPEISLYDNSNLGEVTFQKKGGGKGGFVRYNNKKFEWRF